MLKSTYTVDPNVSEEVVKKHSPLAVRHNTLAHLSSLSQLPIDDIMERMIQRVKASGYTEEQIMDK